jgi:1-phosphofructokinase family hexose kinase
MIMTVTLNPSLDKCLTLERLRLGELNRAEANRVDVGGKGINVSCALLALGVPSLAMGLWGGTTGQRLAQGLQALGIPHDFVTMSGETRSNLTIVEEGEGRVTKLNEPGPTVTPAELVALLERVRARAAPGQWWAFSGSLPPGAPDGTYADLIEVVQAAGARVVLDSSGHALARGWRAQPYGLRCNVEEAEELLGLRLAAEPDLLRVVPRLRDSGVSLACISRGADGAILATGRLTVLARPPRVQVKSPVGAGDAALAGLLYATSAGLDWPDVARWCVAAGTAAAMQEGTAVGDRTLIESLLPQVGVYAQN